MRHATHETASCSPWGALHEPATSTDPTRDMVVALVLALSPKGSFLRSRLLLACSAVTVTVTCAVALPGPVPTETATAAACSRQYHSISVTLDRSQYPYTTDHISDAIAAGEASLLHIDRPGTDQNRREALAGIPTKPGYDRDEYPPAVSSEGGHGASVRYVPSGDESSPGTWCRSSLLISSVKTVGAHAAASSATSSSADPKERDPSDCLSYRVAIEPWLM